MNRSEFELHRIDPRSWKKPSGYANAVFAPPGASLLFLAGQIAWDAEQRIVGPGDFAVQFDQALANVCAVLAEARAEPSSLVRLTIYVTDKQLYLDALKAVGASWKARIGRFYPAMSLVQVAALLEEGALVEIEATAAYPGPTALLGDTNDR